MDIKTFEVGLLQGRAYRMLERELGIALSRFDLLIPEWKLLGQVYSKKNIQPARIADSIGIKRPFVTVLLQRLEHKGLITRRENDEDKRVQYIDITTKGTTIIELVEKEVRTVLKGILKGTNLLEWMAYAKVLNAIVKNGQILEQARTVEHAKNTV